MESYTYTTLREYPELKDIAAKWFHQKWGVPIKAYLECMDAYLNKETEYGWYLCLDGEKLLVVWALLKMTFTTGKTLHPMSVLSIPKRITVVKELLDIC